MKLTTIYSIQYIFYKMQPVECLCYSLTTNKTHHSSGLFFSWHFRLNDLMSFCVHKESINLLFLLESITVNMPYSIKEFALQ